MTQQTIRQQTYLRSPLLSAAEREKKRASYIIFAVCALACVAIVAYVSIGGAA